MAAYGQKRAPAENRNPGAGPGSLGRGSRGRIRFFPTSRGFAVIGPHSSTTRSPALLPTCRGQRSPLESCNLAFPDPGHDCARVSGHSRGLSEQTAVSRLFRVSKLCAFLFLVHPLQVEGCGPFYPLIFITCALGNELPAKPHIYVT